MNGGSQFPYTVGAFLNPATAEVGIDKDEFRYYLPFATDRGFVAIIEGSDNIRGYRLTWEGLQFLQETENPDIWRKFKEMAPYGFDIAREFLPTIVRETFQNLFT